MKLTFITHLKDFACVPYIKNGKWDGRNWITLSDIIVKLEDGSRITVPSGFITNFGSIPSVVRSFLDRMGKSLRAFVVHDYLYSENIPFNKKQRACDEILYYLGREDGESWWDAQCINKGLAVGGWSCFKKADARFEKVSRDVLVYIVDCNGYKLEDK